jgi:hypothetical protein
MAPHEVERREMAGRLAIDLLAGGIDRRAGGGDAEVLHQRLVGPRRDIRRLGAQQRDLLPELGGRPRLLADHLVQGLTRIVEQVPGFDLLGHGQVVAGLRLLDVGDRDEADLEALARLFQLSPQCLQLGPRELQVVRRPEECEIAFGQSHYQLLVDRIDLVLRLADPAVRLFEPDESIAVIERLGHVQAVAVTGEGKVAALEGPGARRDRHLLKVTRDVGRDADRGQEIGPRLRDRFERGPEPGLGPLEHWIPLLRELKQGQEVGGGGVKWHQTRHCEQDGEAGTAESARRLQAGRLAESRPDHRLTVVVHRSAPIPGATGRRVRTRISWASARPATAAGRSRTGPRARAPARPPA